MPAVHSRGVRKKPWGAMMDFRLLTVNIVFLSLCFKLCFSLTYVLTDKEGLGRVFDGIGGLSGGGVSTALLPGPILSTQRH